MRSGGLENAAIGERCSAFWARRAVVRWRVAKAGLCRACCCATSRPRGSVWDQRDRAPRARCGASPATLLSGAALGCGLGRPSKGPPFFDLMTLPRLGHTAPYYPLPKFGEGVVVARRAAELARVVRSAPLLAARVQCRRWHGGLWRRRVGAHRALAAAHRTAALALPCADLPTLPPCSPTAPGLAAPGN